MKVLIQTPENGRLKEKYINPADLKINGTAFSAYLERIKSLESAYSDLQGELEDFKAQHAREITALRGAIAELIAELSNISA